MQARTTGGVSSVFLFELMGCVGLTILQQQIIDLFVLLLECYNCKSLYSVRNQTERRGLIKRKASFALSCASERFGVKHMFPA